MQIRTVVLGIAVGALIAGCSNGPSATPASAGRAALPFEQADLDRDGVLSMQEAVLVSGLDLLAVDRDRDGIISREEYQAWATGARDAVAGTAPAPGAKTR